MSPRPSTGFVLINTVLMAAAVAVAAAAWWPIYLDLHFVIMVAATAVVGSVIAVAGAVRRWPSAVVVPLTLVAFAALGVALAVPAEALYGILPTLAGLRELFVSVALGWKQLLTITLPVGTYQGLLVPAFVSVLLTVVVGLSIALRARRGGVAVIAPVVLFLVGIAFGSREPVWPMQLALGLLAVVLLWLIWRRWHRRRAAIHLLDSTRRQRVLGVRAILSAVVVLAIAGACAVATTVVLPPQAERTVLRSAVEQPFDPRDYPSPLAGFRQYLNNGKDDAVIMRVDGLPEGGRVRIATLDTYDGVVYSVGSADVSSESGSFTRVPQRFDQSGLRGEQVTVTVTVGDYAGVWLPTVGKFEAIDFDGARAPALRDAFYYNDTSGTAAVIGGLEPGDEYTISAVVDDEYTAAQLGALSAGSATVPRIGKPPAELSTRVERYTTGLESQGERLVAVLEGLARDGYISHGIDEDAPPSRSGHSADRINELLTAQRMIGDGEQYAVAAALMATQIGYPTRVVFGFSPESDSDGVVEVTGSMVSAWIEINTAELGWIAVDPTPEEREIPEEEPEEPSTVSRPQSVVQPPIEEQELTDNQSPTEAVDNDADVLEDWQLVLLAIARVLGWTLLVIAIVLSPFLVIIGAKLRRRALRRRAASPLARIAGGWREFEDAVIDHGFTPPAAATRSELAATVGGETSVLVATVADRATFAPARPSADEAAKMWRSIDELTASLDDGLTRWERLRARVSLRSLGGDSVRGLITRQSRRSRSRGSRR